MYVYVSVRVRSRVKESPRACMCLFVCIFLARLPRRICACSIQTHVYKLDDVLNTYIHTHWASEWVCQLNARAVWKCICVYINGCHLFYSLRSIRTNLFDKQFELRLVLVAVPNYCLSRRANLQQNHFFLIFDHIHYTQSTYVYITNIIINLQIAHRVFCVHFNGKRFVFGFLFHLKHLLRTPVNRFPSFLSIFDFFFFFCSRVAAPFNQFVLLLVFVRCVYILFLSFLLPTCCVLYAHREKKNPFENQFKIVFISYLCSL